MMPLTLAAVGHLPSLDVYSGYLVMVNSITHVTYREKKPIDDGLVDDYWSQPWTRTYLTKYAYTEVFPNNYVSYFQPYRDASNHMFRINKVTGLTAISCVDSGLRELVIINNTGSITVYDPLLVAGGGGLTPETWPSMFGLVYLLAYQNSIRTFIIRNAPCLKIVDLHGNQLADIELTDINSNWRSLILSNNYLTSLSITSSQGSELVRENAYFECTDNLLTSIKFKGYPSSIDCRNNFLPTSQVNTILNDLAVSGMTGGTVRLDGQTPPAPPTTGPPDGIAAVVTLLGRVPPWTVVTD